jgi:hypothetical protein
MLGVVLLATSLRLVLVTQNWPIANADESIMDLMARHIAYQGEHPIFFWGQNYMGSIQAYLGAVLMRLVGSPAFSVRLGTLFIFALYLVCLYLLVRLLYTPAYALFIIALLSLGSDRMLGVPLVANGGYAATMLFGVAIFLLASWLALTVPRPGPGTRVSRSRLLAYAGLGLIVGLALWSDQLILPAILTAGLLLLLHCRKELPSRALGAPLLGLLVGATPLILYNIQHLGCAGTELARCLAGDGLLRRFQGGACLGTGGPRPAHLVARGDGYAIYQRHSRRVRHRRALRTADRQSCRPVPVLQPGALHRHAWRLVAEHPPPLGHRRNRGDMGHPRAIRRTAG